MNTNSRPLVAIKCLAFNHGPYIRKCLEGFVMQKTNFPFIAIVHDDASTDNTPDIIREFAEKYPDIIKPIYEKENQYSKHDGSLRRIMDLAIGRTGCRYVALCEGDDYWTDPLKLQKQADFLESNPDYGLVHTKFNILNESTVSEFYKGRNFSKCKNVTEGLLLGVYGIGTLTVVYRKSLYDKLTKHYLNKRFKMGDLPLWIEISNCSKINYMPIVTACYRRLNDSASHSNDINKRIQFENSAYECRKYYASIFSKYELLKQIEKNHDIGIFKIIAKESCNKKKIVSSFYSLAVKYHFISLPISTYIYFFTCICPLVRKLLIWMKIIQESELPR